MNSKEDLSWNHSVIGGTFDHIHAGHLLMLATASQSTLDTFHVGIAADELLKNKKFAEQLDSIEIRMERVRKIMNEQNPKLNLNIFQIRDPYGPTLESDELQMIIVSEETKSFTEEKINKVRKENGKEELYIVCVPLLNPPDEFAAEGTKLSSTQLRKLDAENENK